MAIPSDYEMYDILIDIVRKAEHPHETVLVNFIMCRQNELWTQEPYEVIDELEA